MTDESDASGKSDLLGDPLATYRNTGAAGRHPTSSGLVVPAFAWRLLGSVGVGVALSLSFPPCGWAFLLPTAIAALILLIQGATSRQAFYIGLVSGLFFFGISLRWLSGMFGVAALSLWTISACYPALFCALLVWIQRKLPRIPLWVLAPFVWTGTEYLRSEVVPPKFTWMGLGYGLVNAGGLAGLASWYGSYGLTFGIVLVGAFMADLFQSTNRMGRGRVEAMIVSLLSMLTVASSTLLVYAFMDSTRRSAGDNSNRSINVRLIQGRSEEDSSMFLLSSTKPNNYALQFIVWPEYSYVSDPRSDLKTWRRLLAIPKAQNCYFLFGGKDVLDKRDDKAFRNTVWVIGPNGDVVGTHIKNHTVPFINDGIPGSKADVFSTAYGKVGVGTCFDMDFPDVARRSVEQGAQYLLVPSDNPEEWGPLQHLQHRLLFQMRAIECNRWLAATDVAGSTYSVEPHGMVVQSVKGPDETSLDVRLDPLEGKTLFVRGGWRFGPLCLAALGALCIGAAINRPK